MKNSILICAAVLSLAACSQSSDTAPEARQANTLISVTSENSFAQTNQKLKVAIETRSLKLFSVVDHGQGAKSVDLDIGQSKLYIFGNPKAGTPLMIANPEMGLELPLKILIRETQTGDVRVSYKDIGAIASAYKITGKDELIGKISGNLAAIADEATR